MGYSTRPEMVSENVEILSQIKKAIDAGESLKLRVKNNAEISSEQYRLRRVLAATDNHPTAYGGEFARLGSRTSLKVDAAAGYIVATPRAGVSLSLEEYRANDKDALDLLSEAKGSMIILEFYPTKDFVLEEFSRKAESLGWKVFPEAASTEDDGKVSFPAERIGDSEEEKVLDRFLRE